ncbi:M48 family metallopeptidase [Paenibacillaceae bacterium WGS1546]|uniref:M48 family metallopeptidase n=1 Tax=Cohnella sp. WGS1546 TaxID=3366810 RepID=UPI00372D4539
MRLSGRTNGKRILIAFACYAILIAIYVWYTSPNDVPEAYRGTAADPATYFPPERLKDSETLNAARNFIFFLSGPWEWLIYFWMLASGLAEKWRERLERRNWPIYARFPVFVLLVHGAAFLLYFPLRIAGYSLSKSFGISTQPVVGWLKDKLIDFGVGYVTLLAVSAVAFWIVSKGGRWWLKLWLLSVPFTLFMMYVQPVVIDPLYNKFSPLADSALEERILALADKADIPADRVYEVDMSEKTNALNAYVNGIGSSLRIVLWDTTLERLDEPEILHIMAHEMGHYVMRHLEWSAVGAVGSSFALLLLGSRIYEAAIRRRGKRWGIRSASDMTALPLALLILTLLSFAALPASNFVSRQAEAAADRYALELIGSAEGAVTMNQKMAVAALSDAHPPLLVKWFRDTHPSDLERIRDAYAFDRTTAK